MPINAFTITSQDRWSGQAYKREDAQLQNPTTPSRSLAISRPASFLPQVKKTSSDSEMAISKVSTVESVFHGAAEAPKGVGVRAAGEGNGARMRPH